MLKQKPSNSIQKEYEYDSGIDVQMDEEYVFKACMIDKLMDWFVQTTLDGFLTFASHFKKE
ncbi:MAG: hypothetical protein IPH96_17875 [Saprospiraceae bacterium]|nr:hypothetical protein [Saprospiraceae bacterium]